MNNVHFSDHFKRLVRGATKSDVQFGLVPSEHWDIPSTIDLIRAKGIWKAWQAARVIYGGSAQPGTFAAIRDAATEPAAVPDGVFMARFGLDPAGFLAVVREVRSQVV